MKKILITIMILILISGCTNNTTYQNNNSNNNDNNDNNENINNIYKKIVNFNCPEFNENILEISTNYFIDNKGNLYKYSFEKIFYATKTNCSKIDTKGKYIAGISGNSVYDNNNYFYFFEDIEVNNNVFNEKKYNEYQKSREYFIKKSFPNSDKQLWLITDRGIIAENNQIFKIDFDFSGGHKIKDEIKLNTDEKIINIYRGNKLYSFFVETDNFYYICENEIINKEKCETYADIKCKYEIICNKIDNLNKSEIKNFLGTIIITKDNNVYKYIDT